MFSACSCAHSACSLMPGRSAACIAAHRRLAGRERAAHRLDLVGSALSARASSITSWPSCSTSACGLERRDAVAIGLVEREPAVAAAMGAHQRRDLGRPEPGVLGHPLAAVEVVPGARRPHLVDQLEVSGEMRAAVEVEQDDRALGRDEGVAHRVVQAPDLHVGAVGGVAQVDRVADHDAGEIARRELARAAARGGRGAAPRDRAARGRSARHSLERERARPEIAERALPGARAAAAATILER